MSERLSANAVMCNRMAQVAISEEHFRLLDLPAELRNKIYELVVYHGTNNGCIAPVPIHEAEFSGLGSRSFFSVLRGRRQEFKSVRTIGEAKKHARHLIPAILKAITDHLAAGGSVEDKVLGTPPVEGQQGSDIEPQWVCGHLCSPDCLLQPAVTKVCRQLRDETLPLFYGMNNFHLEVSSEWGLPRKTRFRKAMVSWWRQTGDSNLRLVNNLTVLSRDVRVEGEDFFSKPFELRFGKSQGRLTFTITSGDKKYVLKNGKELATEDGTAYRGIDLPTPAKCIEYGGQVEEGGLFVRGLEEILGSNLGVFRDYVVVKAVDQEEFDGAAEALAKEPVELNGG